MSAELPTFRRCAWLLATILLFAAAAEVMAEPLEAPLVAEDPVLEQRINALSHDLRCLVCQNESLAGSRAPLAMDLRHKIREQMIAGKTDEEILTFLVDRYGDFILYQPPFKASTVLLWLGPIMLMLAMVLWLLWRLRRQQRESAPSLSAAEQARARTLLATPPRAYDGAELRAAEDASASLPQEDKT